MSHIFGYVASTLLVWTIFAQIKRQWESQSTKGVSPWLFLGQIAASTGFAIHSSIIGSGLFVVTNVLVGIAAIIGLVMFMILRRRTAARCEHEGASSAPPPRAAGARTWP